MGGGDREGGRGVCALGFDERERGGGCAGDFIHFPPYPSYPLLHSTSPKVESPEEFESSGPSEASGSRTSSPRSQRSRSPRSRVRGGGDEDEDEDGDTAYFRKSGEADEAEGGDESGEASGSLSGERREFAVGEKVHGLFVEEDNWCDSKIKSAVYSSLSLGASNWPVSLFLSLS